MEPVKWNVRGEEFPDGSIVRIVFDNFLSFGHLECFPSPNLNIIIGCNGTGKSSILCGICLAFGGSPKFLGRSERMDDYVKNLKDNGSVEVFVRDSMRPEGYFRIKIEIVKPNSVKHTLDGKHITLTAVKALAAKYNIQVGNPCAFLAQDKVRSFAEQNPQVLLENTEKAGSPELNEAHAVVRKLMDEGSGPKANRAKIEGRLAAVEAKLASLGPRVENYRHYAQMVEKVQLLEKKLVMLECEAVLSDIEREGASARALEEEIETLKESLQPVDRKIRAEQKELDSVSRKLKFINGERMATAKKLKGVLDEASIPNLLMQKSERYEQLKMAHKEWQANLEKSKGRQKDFEKKMREFEDEARTAQENLQPLREKYAEAMEKKSVRAKQRLILDRELDSLVEQTRALRHEETVRLEERLNTFGSLTRRSESERAYRFYESHKEQFRCPVYVPFLSLNLLRNDAALYVENVILYRDFFVFVFGCEEDETLLNRSGDWRIDSSVLTKDEIQRYSRVDEMSAQYRSAGFTCYVSNLFSAPQPVMAYINNVASTNKIPVGSAALESRIEEICERFKGSLKLFLTPTKKVTNSMSRYSRLASIVVQPLKTRLTILANFGTSANSTDDAEARRAKIAAVERRLTEVRSDRQKLEEELQQLTRLAEERLESFNASKQAISRLDLLKQSIASWEKSIRSMQANEPDLAGAKREFEMSKAKVMDDAYARANQSVAYLRSALNSVRSVAFMSRQYAGVRKRLADLQERKVHFTVEVDLKVSELKENEKEIAHMRRQFLECLEVLKTKTKLSTVVEAELQNADERNILRKLQEDFKAHNVPETVELAQQELGLERGRLQATRNEGEENDLATYNGYVEKRELLRNEATANDNKVAGWEKRMDEALAKWLRLLEALIANIDRHFGRNFARLGCSGEVHLLRPADKNEVDKYGIALMVRYRHGEPLQRLTHLVQSGGERSVATMLYMMALQEECPVPFRCVDEINQGMDPANERQVMEMMMEMLSGGGRLSKTQYFLLTPKLLKGLHYNKMVRVHCIYSGVHMCGELKPYLPIKQQTVKHRRQEHEDTKS